MIQRPISRAIPALLSVLAVLALLPSLSGCTLELDYDKYAVVFGVAEYDPAWGTNPPNLKYTDDDVWAMEDLLNQQGFEVTPYTHVDSAATLAQLQIDFADVASKATSDDLFLFYYSGHGGQIAPGLPGDSETVPNSDSNDEWIFLYDSYKSTLPPPEYTDLTKTINDDELATLLRTIPCVRKIVILDACNSGGFIGNVLEKDGILSDFSFGSDGIFTNLSNAVNLYTNFDGDKSDIPSTDALVIAASGEREESYEGLYDHGVMTYFLLKSATKGDLNRDGYITVSESYYYIYKNINTNWNNTTSALIYDVFFPRVSGGPIDYILFTK
jgi:uncharacterized caspase-like protein